MPDPLVVRLANEFRRQLQARDAVQMAEMARRWLQVDRRLRGEINWLTQEVYARWWEGGAHGDRRTLLELDRYRALLAQVQREMQAYQRYAEEAITTGQATRAQMGIHDAGRLIEAASGGEIYAGFRRLPVEAVHNIVALARGGQPLARLLETAYPQAAEGITALLLEGTALGWNPRRTAARIMDDGLAQGLNHILLVARDQQIRAYRTAALQQYRESGLVVSYRRLAAKHPRTCLACLALDGREYPTEELMPLHPQDRCAMVPVVKGFAPIQFETGEAWFGRQSPATQAAMMGPGRYEAWTKGEFAFRELATVKPNEVWGPRAQVTPLKDLLSTRLGHSWFKGELPSVAAARALGDGGVAVTGGYFS